MNASNCSLRLAKTRQFLFFQRFNKLTNSEHSNKAICRYNDPIQQSRTYSKPYQGRNPVYGSEEDAWNQDQLILYVLKGIRDRAFQILYSYEKLKYIKFFASKGFILGLLRKLCICCFCSSLNQQLPFLIRRGKRKNAPREMF